MSWAAVLTALGLALAVSLAVMRPAIRLAGRMGLIDRPGQHKRHLTPTPVVGGPVLFVAMWLSLLVCLLLFRSFFEEFVGSLIYVFAGALIIVLVGLADDLRPLSAWAKLVAQVAAGLVLHIGGLHVNPITVPFVGSIMLGGWSVVVTVVWVVMLTNAVNLIDGLDGLATGVSLIAALTMAVIAHLYSAGQAVWFAYALVGFLAVFLIFNRYPAKAFLGDSGALQIGYYFAVMSLMVPLKSFTAAALYLPLLTLAVPLLETASSISRRLVSGRNVMQADRRHLFHYLALAGLSPRAIVAVFYSLSAVFGLFAVAMFFWDRKLVFGVLVIFMVVISVGFFIFMTKSGRSARRISGRQV